MEEEEEEEEESQKEVKHEMGQLLPYLLVTKMSNCCKCWGWLLLKPQQNHGFSTFT